jgi:uncharacterized protein (TIGR02147 family)
MAGKEERIARDRGEKSGVNDMLPDVFAYLDYRMFLRDFCASKQKRNRHFSYRYLSGKIGIRSGGFFSWVLKGKRNISGRLALDLSRFLGFTRPQTAYFGQLVTFNQAGTHEERKLAFDKLLSMRRGSIKQVGVEQSEFYGTWYYSALRELVSVMPVTDENIAEVAAVLSPSVKRSEVVKALTLLTRLGLICKNEWGVYERADDVLSSNEYIPTVALHGYQIGCMELAKTALDRFEKNERELSTVTMSIDDEAYRSIIERLAVCRSEVMEIARSVKRPSRVIQLNLQLFPLSRRKDEGRHE